MLTNVTVPAPVKTAGVGVVGEVVVLVALLGEPLLRTKLAQVSLVVLLV